MSKVLNMHPVAFFNTYCRSHIGDVSRIPIVRLNSVGSDARCPLLKNNKCSVHKVKPAVCALFPLGRYIAADAGKDVSSQMEEAEVKYLLQPLECGDESETDTVREWLSGFDISLEDEFFIKWNTMIQKLGEVLKIQETKQDMLAMMEIWAVTRVVMYLKYDTTKPFMPQFEENCEGMMELLKDIPKLRAILHKAHADAMKQKGVTNAPYAM